MTPFAWRAPAFFLLLLTAIRVFAARGIEAVPPEVWLFGLVADWAALMLVAAPVVLACLPSRPALRSGLVGVVVAVVLIVAVAEVFFWHEFEARLDRLVFHYLAYPVEVLTFLEEQFYVKWILVPFLLLVVLLTRLLGPPPQLSWQPAGLALVFAIGTGFLVVQPVVDQSRRLTQLASNGYVGVLVAARVDQTRWSALYPDVPAATGTFVHQPELPPTVAIDARHVILIIEESFAGSTWENPAERVVHLPAFTALSASGLRFDNIYAAGTRTTRGMESVMHGFPPLPGISATERPGFARLPSLPRLFRDQGYQTVFAYGGWPDFSNFTAYWRGIGFARTTSRHDFPEGTFETSWGVSDRDLFTHVLGLMDEMTTAAAPVFLATLTVSNHRPFIVPAGEPGAEARSLQSAMHYADAALGYFFSQARLRPWYPDTVFVVVADHGPRIHGDSLIPVESYRVPLLLLSPPELAPAVVNERGSSAGIAATLAALFGFPATERFWSPSLLDGKDGPVLVEHDYHVGELGDGELTVLARGGRFYRWQAGGGGFIPAGEISAQTPAAKRLAEVFSQAHAVFYPR